MLGLDTVSRHAKAALESDTLYNRQEQLRLALDTTESMRQGFAYDLRALEHRDTLKSDKNDWGFQIELVRRWIRKTQLGLKR